MTFDTILIANRGEIALRITKTARALGYRTVAVYSEADAEAQHVKEADTAVCLGPADSAQSYLNGDKVIAAAKKSGAGAIHPGYGFLSENASFAQSCADNGLVFIGPTPDAIRDMGDKSTAKRLMLAAGVPCVPGYHGTDQSLETLQKEAAGIGFPVMIKASAGGGGKGMRLVADAAAFPEALTIARAEALAAFGSDDVLLEKAVVAPRHVEFQVFADAHGNVLHLGERDCSVQRRHQKILEETPCPVLTDDLRNRMGAAAVTAARSIGYIGAGTIEFLLDQDQQFYFLEMNTRLQVEHPVTEMVTGTDLVAWQIEVAQGRALPGTQDGISATGSAIEARLYAEDPGHGFLPSTGRIVRLDMPELEGVRVDTGVIGGDHVTPHYDPMLAKVIAHGATRDEARRRLIRMLREMCLFGPKTNRAYLIDALSHPNFVNGLATTDFVETCLPETVRGRSDDTTRQIAIGAAVLFTSLAVNTRPRLTRPAYFRFHVDGRNAGVVVQRGGTSLSVRVNDQLFSIDDLEFYGQSWRAGMDGITARGAASVDGQGGIWIDEDGIVLHLQNASGDGGKDVVVGDPGQITAPMHGSLVELRASVGDVVTKGQPVAVLEAMKMQHVLQAGQDGVLTTVHVAVGEQVEAGQTLAVITPIEG